MNADLTIQVRREPGYALVTVAGEIDIASVAALRERLNALVQDGGPVIADLGQVGFMDASGLGAIVGASRRAAAHGTSLHVVGGRRVRQLFRLAGLERQVPLAPTLGEALEHLHGSHYDPDR
jgi:anti-sigma B factor antagonist